MKNLLPQLTITFIALVAFTFLMSYTHPAADEPKQYMVVQQIITKDYFPKLEQQVNQKMAEGWRPQGGIAINLGYVVQPMVK